MLKKAKLYFLLATMVASMAVGLFSTPQTVNAQSSTPDPFIPVDMIPTIEARMLREAMIKCLMGSVDIKRGEITKGNWFPLVDQKSDGVIDNNLNVGFFTEPVDGRLLCDEGDGSGFVKAFANAYGYESDYGRLACDLGFKPYYYVFVRTTAVHKEVEGSTSCTSTLAQSFPKSDVVMVEATGSTEAILATDIVYRYEGDVGAAYAAITNIYDDIADLNHARYGNGYPGNNTIYAIYTKTLHAACGVGSAYLGDAAAQGNALGPVKVVSPPMDDNTGMATITEVYYSYNSSNFKKDAYVRILNNGNKNNQDLHEGGENPITCQELINEINRLAEGYATWVYEQDFTEDELAAGSTSIEASSEAGSASTCRVDAIGWLICPVLNFMARMVDGTYEILEDSLLQVPPLIVGPVSENDEARSGLYESWKMMRDFANVVFVISFLVIVFSQLTNVGVSNYGIKRLLPKLVVSAILVNISYFICAVAVDLSNILGNSLKNFLDGAAGIPDINPGTFGDGGGVTGAAGWAAITATILGSGALIGGPLAILALLIPLLFSALGAVVTVVLVLVLRQVLIILLIVIAPLAFVALLLPNTESYFSRWRGVFTTMLLMYPIVALIFGASNLASKIIMASSEQTLVQLMGAAAAIIPLAITPVIMRFAGGVLNRFAGIVNDSEKGLIDRARNRSMEGVGRLQKNQEINTLRSKVPTSRRGRVGEFLSGRSSYRRSADLEGEDAIRDSELGRVKTDYRAQRLSDDDYARRLAQGDEAAMERIQANAQFTLEKLELDEVKAAGVTVQNMNLSELNDIMKDANTSAAKKAAALDRMITIGSPEDYQDYVNEYGSRKQLDSSGNRTVDKSSDQLKTESIIRSTMAEAVAKNNPAVRAADVDNMKNAQMGEQRVDARGNAIPGEFNSSSLSDMTVSNTAAGVISERKMATMSNDDLDYAFKQAQVAANAGNPEALQQLIETANKLQNNEQLRGDIQHNRKKIQDVASSTYTPPAFIGPTQPPPPAAGKPLPTSYTNRNRSVPPQNVQAAVTARGGLESMSDGDIAAIANTQSAHPIGQDALAEINRRGGARALAQRRRDALKPSNPTRADDV